MEKKIEEKKSKKRVNYLQILIDLVMIGCVIYTLQYQVKSPEFQIRVIGLILMLTIGKSIGNDGDNKTEEEISKETPIKLEFEFEEDKNEEEKNKEEKENKIYKSKEEERIEKMYTRNKEKKMNKFMEEVDKLTEKRKSKKKSETKDVWKTKRMAK